MSRQIKYRVTYASTVDRTVKYKTITASTPMDAVKSVGKEVTNCKILSVTPEYKFS